MGAWFRALCSLSLVAISLFDAGADAGDAKAAPRSLSLVPSVASVQSASSPDAPTIAGCPVTVLPKNGGTSTNERAPHANFKFGRAVYLITATEVAANGLMNGTVPSAIGWHYTRGPIVVATGSLTVYLENTADTINTKSTMWNTAIDGMTLVHNSASTTLPNTTAPFDITFTGGAPFVYTGGALYVAFDWQWDGPVGTAAIVACTTSLAGGLKGAQSNIGVPAVLTATDFRPETRLTPSVATIFNDASVDFVLAMGSLAQPLVGPQTVQAVITNRGVTPLNNLPVTFELTGAESFTNTQSLATLPACGLATVTFAPFTPSAIGSDTVTVSVPPDDVAANDSQSKPMDESFNLSSYKHPGTTASGGVGQTGATGGFVSAFTVAAAAKISAVDLEFVAASATTYRVAIYPDSGGFPGLLPLYLDAADRTVSVAGPATIMLSSPVAVGPGTFYAGILQTNTTNANLSFDNEAPIRSGAFFLATPIPPTAWSDFAPGNDFKPNIGVTLVQCATVADCQDDNACTDDACTNQLCIHTAISSTSCDGNSCTDPDQCVGGSCIPGSNPCDDHDACTVDVCDGQGGCTYPAVDCNDNDGCTDDSCLPASGCAHGNNTAPCIDGNPCTIGDVCGDGACVPGSAALPPAVQVCKTSGLTIPIVGAATPYPSAIVVIGQPAYLCSVSVVLAGITHSYPDDIDVLLARPTGANALILSDVGGDTAVTDVSLTVSDAAATALPDDGPLVAGTFRPTNSGSGDVFPPPAPAPTGGAALSVFKGTNPNGSWNLWGDDAFSPDGGTLSGWCIDLVSVCTPGAACSDGNACTANDACVNGVCVGGPPPACNDADACTADICNATTGNCENPAIVCDDNTPCTNDVCSPTTGCAFTPNNNACDDDNLCTGADACQDGVCVGDAPVVCDEDANVCTTEACDPATGACASIDNTNPCDDGNACTTGEVCGPRFVDAFDGVTAPALPAGWTTGVFGSGSPWTTVSASSATAPNSAFGFDGPAVADEVLTGPPIAIAQATATLTFRNRWSFEGTSSFFDGGVLEIAIGGFAFTDIVSAGGSFVFGGYTGVISNSFGNPLGGRPAWTGISAGFPAYLTTVVSLPAAAAGQTIQLRWRVGTDAGTGAAGQNIDSIVVVDATHTCNAGTPITAPPEVTDVTAPADKAGFSWSTAAFATRYDAVRGTAGTLPVGPDGGDDAVCFDDLPGTSLVDPVVPALGSAFWYVLRGENACGPGSYGTESKGAQRMTTTCP